MTAATISAASSARAERAEKRATSVKLPSNPFAGKQYLGLILPLALIAPVLSWRSAANLAATWRFLLSVC